MLSLAELKRYLQSKKSCTLEQLCIFMKEEAGVVQPMAQYLVNKGLICERRLTRQCGQSCFRCGENAIIVYTWIENHNFQER